MVLEAEVQDLVVMLAVHRVAMADLRQVAEDTLEVELLVDTVAVVAHLGATLVHLDLLLAATHDRAVVSILKKVQAVKTGTSHGVILTKALAAAAKVELYRDVRDSCNEA